MCESLFPPKPKCSFADVVKKKEFLAMKTKSNAVAITYLMTGIGVRWTVVSLDGKASAMFPDDCPQ
jgi:hypothetical protein